MRFTYLLFIMAFISGKNILYSQVSTGGIPPSFSISTQLKSAMIPAFIPPPDVQKLKREDASNDKVNTPYRIAENLDVELNIANSGKWDTLSTGEIIWQLKVYSPGALGLRLIYNDFFLPPGTKLFLYNESHDFVIGAFTNQNNHSSGMFATEIIPGESCILEYVTSAAITEKPRININRVGFIYRGMDTFFPEEANVKSSGSCEVSVNCSPEGDNWKDVKRSVTMIILDKYQCSGTLLNNTSQDFKGYISTAFHCIDSIESTASTWIFYFDFERSACSTSSSKAIYKTLSGSYIRAKTPIDKGGDGALLELFGTIPTSNNAYWAGWDRTGDKTSGGVGIHHPQGDYKKISTSRSDWYTTTWHGVDKSNGATGAHWSVVFSKTINGFGVTEGGSSGSGIFGPDELYRGSLSGGLSDCDNPYYANLYGKLFYDWDKYSTDSAFQYKCWLDPKNTGVTRILGTDKSTVSGVKVYWTSSLPVTFVDSAVQFKDETSDNEITRKWYFEGGTPTTSTEKEPIVFYKDAGVYNVKLEVTKNAVVYTKLRTDYVVVQSSPVWLRQSTGFPEPSYGIEGIDIVDSLVVWAWAIDLSDTEKPSLAYTRTSNGGANWKANTINFSGITGYGIGNLFALNKDIAYATVFAPSATGGGKILRTINGGASWNQQSTALFNAPSGFPNFVYFFDNNQGVCMGDPNDGYFEIYTTTNGGDLWNRVVPAKIPAKSTNEYGTTNFYDAVGDTIWFGTTLGRIFRSIDRGLNWQVFTTGLTDATDVKFRDALHGYAIKKASPYTIKKTVDGGANWLSYTLPDNLLQGELAYVPKTKSTWVSVLFNSPSGSSYSTDDGTTYTSLESGIPYSAVSFYNSSIGWAGGFNIDSVNGGIYKWNAKNWVLTSNPGDISLDSDMAEFYVYPNPVQDVLYIKSKINNSSTGFIEIYNLQGSKLSSTEQKLYSGEVISLDISTLKAGLYILKISGGHTKFACKIVKE